MLLRIKDKERLQEIFLSAATPMEVWAYGSRVNGTAHDGSDLDLVIRSPKQEILPLDLLLELKDKIQTSNIPIIVELFDWARLPEHFHQSILQKHEVLFSNMQTMANEAPAPYKSPIDRKDNRE